MVRYLPVLIALLVGTGLLYPGQAKIIEEKLIFTTYPFSDPDPIPRMSNIYPYARFDRSSSKTMGRKWQMIRLENPYITVWVCPEIGGKVWGAREKSTGRHFIYYNKVVKFREIAMRGPWTSGGIEFNFGAIGHAPNTATAVNYITRENEDGSVSCTVGTLDLASRTSWRVKITLPEDKAFFQTQSSWYNPTPVHHSYYHWTNAAADAGPDLRFYYPGSAFIDHDGNVHPWPKDEKGRDISLYRANNFGSHKSYHVLGRCTEHFGGYWEDADFGFGHWSLYDDKPGKKLWLWALSRQGEIWKDLLTDPGNSQYVEFQSGRLYNQAAAASSETPFKHAAFAPYGFDRWDETWFPVKGTGGMVDCSPHGILNVTRSGPNVKIRICALQHLEDELVVEKAGKTISRDTVEVAPMEVYEKSLELESHTGKIQVRLGRDKLFYDENGGHTPLLKRPLKAAPGFDWNSVYGLFTAGQEAARQRRYREALDYYKACLEKEPFHLEALAAAAEILYRNGRYREALDYTRKLLSIDAYHGAGNFVYGLVNRELGSHPDAKDGFGWAARSPAYRSAAYTQIAEIYYLEGNLERAETYALRALDYNRFNLTAYRLRALIKRLEQKHDEAKEVVAQILEIDPLDHVARFELYMLQPDEQRKTDFTSMISSELSHEIYLESAIFYARLGMNREAAALLELSPSYPTVHYWLAYLYRELDPGKSAQFLDRAGRVPCFLVFPFRRETIPVLRWAIEKQDNWKGSYYLSLLLWSKGRENEALQLLENCGDPDDFYIFYLVRAELRTSRSPGSNADAVKVHAGILADLKKAARIEKENWRPRHQLTLYYMKRGMYREALRSAKKGFTLLGNHQNLIMDYAKALLLTGAYDKCLDVLSETVILPYEGAREGRHMYRRANLLAAATAVANKKYARALAYIAKAGLWPENLGAGKPFDPDERLEKYLEALCRRGMGEHDKADVLYREIAAYTLKFHNHWNGHHYLGLLALQKTGQTTAATQLLEEWRQAPKINKDLLDWVTAKLDNRQEAARSIVEQRLSTHKNGLWAPVVTDESLLLLLQVLDKLR